LSSKCASPWNALKKMSKFGVKIGYPDKWLDYSSLAIDESDHFLSMVFKAREFENLEEAKEMNAPTDKLKWFLTPQTVNAYYHPNLNEIVFPAAILQHPFFDKDADDAVNFGSMGAVIGHEMTVNLMVVDFVHFIVLFCPRTVLCFVFVSMPLMIKAENSITQVTWLIGGRKMMEKSMKGV